MRHRQFELGGERPASAGSYETLLVEATIEPGVPVGRHTHPGMNPPILGRRFRASHTRSTDPHAQSRRCLPNTAPKRPMRVESRATPSPEFLSPMLWRRGNPSHLRPDHLRVGRSFVCRVVLADHLAARVCAPAALGTCHRELAGSRRRRHDKSHHGNRLATATVAGEAAQLPTSSRGTSCHRTQRARYPTPRIGHPLSAKEAERTLRSGLQVTWTICGQTCRSGGAIFR